MVVLVQTICAQAAKACKEQGKSIAKLAVQYALRNRNLITTLIGMPSVAEVSPTIPMCRNSVNLDEDPQQNGNP